MEGMKLFLPSSKNTNHAETNRISSDFKCGVGHLHRLLIHGFVGVIHCLVFSLSADRLKKVVSDLIGAIIREKREKCIGKVLKVALIAFPFVNILLFTKS